MILQPPASCKVYTHPDLAKTLVEYLGDKRDYDWLEPCVGQGVFIDALCSAGVEPKRIRGMDIDPTHVPTDNKAQVLRGCDFLAWSADTEERFDRVVGNPPYLSFRRLPPELREVALRVRQPDGERISGNANCWLAFLCSAVRLLRQGGALGFVLPAAWEYADYAQSLRNYFCKSFEDIEVHRCSRPLFELVQEGSIVLIGKGYLKSPLSFQRFLHTTPKALISALNGPSQRSPLGRNAVSKTKVSGNRQIRQLKEIMEIRLGGVTGDAGYFLLSEKQRREHRLPVTCLRPVLSKAQHLPGSELTSKAWLTLRDSGARVWLFRPPPSLLTHPHIAAYLILGKNRPAGHKVSRRTPWYQTPLPRSCDGFLSGMSSAGPWIALRVMPRLIATNTLYIIRFLKRYSLDERAAWALAMLTSEVRTQWQEVRRVYAAGLAKLEPGDLGRLLLPEPHRVSGARKVLGEATAALLDGNAARASEIADGWFRDRRRQNAVRA